MKKSQGAWLTKSAKASKSLPRRVSLKSIFLVRLDEVVLEIVEVVDDGLPVEAFGGVGLRVVQTFVSKHLQFHQMAQRLFVK